MQPGYRIPHHTAMPKRVKHEERSKDVNQLARQLVEESPDEPGNKLPTKAQISALMAELGRKGGRIGGKRRMKTMTAKERSDIARRAATARWKKTVGV